MASNGLFLSLKEFNRLPNGSKLSCLYENQLKTFKMFETQKKVYDSIRLNQKIQYGIITALIAGVVFLIKHAVAL